MELSETIRLSALPVQFIQTASGIILKRGCIELRISGDKAAQVIQRVMTATTGRTATWKEICEYFAAPLRQHVGELVEELVDKRILIADGTFPLAVDNPESSLEIFYWHFGETAKKVTERLNSHYIAVLGVNCISRQLTTALLDSGLISIDVIDVPSLRNLRLFDDRGKLDGPKWATRAPLEYEPWVHILDQKPHACLVATCDFGGHESLREWNQLCVERNYHFLPVVLKDLVGHVGPLVIPGETACFECLRARQNSHFNDPESKRATEETAFQGQPFIGFHPSMGSILGDVAAFELTKLYSGILPKRNVGTLIEINLLATYLTARKVLKAPRCKTCSPLKTRAPVQAARKTLSIGKVHGK